MTILHAGQQRRHRYKEQTLGLCGRRRGWDDLREEHRNMYITICEIDQQSNSMHETGHPKAVHWDNPEGWAGEGVGRGFQDGVTCTPMADSCQCTAKICTTL